MKHYFCLSESYNGEHIGIIVASSTEELRSKIVDALEGHFDTGVEKFSEVVLKVVVESYGIPCRFEVHLEDHPIPLDVEIIKSYLY